MSNYVISISREFGSGGRMIGKQLAARLGIPCYDRTLIQKTAEKSGLSPEFIARAEERARSRIHLPLASLGTGVAAYTQQGVPVSLQAFFAQSEVIRELADEGPCVIVGRCADYILREHPNCLNVFVHADKAARIKRIVGKGLCEEKKAPDFVTKKDKQRANYYNFYSNNRWDDLKNYDITIDTSKFPVDKAVELLIAAAKELET